MTMLLNPRFWGVLAMLAAIAFGLWWHSQKVEATRKSGYDAGMAAVQKLWDAERESLREAAEKANRENQTRKEAQNEAVQESVVERTQAEQRARADLDAVRAERDGLRQSLGVALNTISACSRDLSAAAQDAAAAGSAAVAAVFDDMEREGAEMARAADGHHADAVMLQKAWPK